MAEAAPELLDLFDAARRTTRARSAGARGYEDACEPSRELREALAPERRAGRSIGLVPTMGSLHEGHLSLLRRAREDCDVVVMSLFVNPTQFGPSEDLDAYPRDERRDAALAEAEGVDLLFAPPLEEVYPPGFDTTRDASPASPACSTAPPSGAGPSTSPASPRS